MSQWLHALGHSAERINALNIVHVAGTKGKGSTCAFTESFLRAHGIRTGFPSKTGLYTSPHLIVPQERIRINSKPLDRENLAKYFFEVYDKLPQLSADDSAESKPVVERGPRFLQLYALLAFHVFIRENVDVAIIETHSGGEYDATNVVEKPVVTAITTLGMDHVEMLGPAIENIAWHKSGIYKAGAVALSTTQEPAPAAVLQRRAVDKGRSMKFIGEDSRLPADALALKPHVQRKNASLAIAVAESWLNARSPTSDRVLSQEDINLGVSQWSWPGRFQIIRDDNATWFLDAAHNAMSVEVAAQWFLEASSELNTEVKAEHVVVFSHISETRDVAGVLSSLADALRENGARISHVIFTTYDKSEEEKGYKAPQNSAVFHDIWKQVFPNTGIWDEPTIQGACQLVERLSERCDNATGTIHALVTGSQHLVGPTLRYLQDRSDLSSKPPRIP